MQFFKRLLSDIRKARTFYQSIIFPWFWQASCSKCVCMCQHVQISVSQDKLTQSTVAGGSSTALNVNFEIAESS